MIAVEQIGIDRIIDRVETAIRKAKSSDLILKKIGGRIVNEAIPDYFSEERDPFGNKWQGLSEKYKRKKEKAYGAGKLILELSGNLKKSIRYKTEDLRVIITGGDGDTNAYAAIHNYGGYTGKAEIPKRQYLGIGEKEKDIVNEAIKNWLRELL